MSAATDCKRTEWQLPRQSGYAGAEAVADANRFTQAALDYPTTPPWQIVHEKQRTPCPNRMP